MKLLLAVDTSSAHAVGAAATALFPDAECVLFNAVPFVPALVPETVATGAAVAVPSVDALDAAEREGDEAIDAVRSELGVFAPAVSTVGDPGVAICDEALAIGADVIVLGRSDRGWLSRLVAPSVATYVVRHAPCPVLVVAHDGDAVHAHDDADAEPTRTGRDVAFDATA